MTDPGATGKGAEPFVFACGGERLAGLLYLAAG